MNYHVTHFLYTVMQAAVSSSTKVTYSAGCEDTRCTNKDMFNDATAAAKNADV